MLYDELKNNNRIPFHMPGHKRNTKLLGKDFPYDIDITEIEGFDNLHKPEGIIREIEKKAEEVYGAERSFILVNGSTVGILAGISSVLKRGDTVLMARNCHKSVYKAVELVGAVPEYILPETDEYGIFGEISPEAVQKGIEKFSPKLIVLTSPTYEGVCSDISEICKTAHLSNIPVLLDAAHGAHNIELGGCADIVIMSLHKTLPALTQCAIAHINGALVSSENFEVKLSVFETSSPSYVLMSSAERCLDFLRGENRSLEILMTEAKSSLIETCKNLKHLKLIEYDDITKLIVFTGYSDINGAFLADKLREDYGIEVEMAAENYILLILTSCDDFSHYKLLSKALNEVDKGLNDNQFICDKTLSLPEKALNSCDVTKSEPIDFYFSEGNICAEYIWAYPPGIPLIVPGEIIDLELIDYITYSLNNGVNIQSTRGRLPKEIYCLKQGSN